jgi:hypothetical protein
LLGCNQTDLFSRRVAEKFQFQKVKRPQRGKIIYYFLPRSLFLEFNAALRETKKCNKFLYNDDLNLITDAQINKRDCPKTRQSQLFALMKFDQILTYSKEQCL